ncbi:S1 family peptidase, partial [Nocardia sp. CC216A]
AGEARRAARAAGFEVRAAERSEVALARDRSAFDGWLAEQPDAVTEAVHGVGIDVIGNRIVVRVERAGVAMPPFVAPDSVVVQARPVAAPLAPTGSAGLGSTGPLPETGPAPGAENYWRNTPRTPSGTVAAADPYVAVAGSTGAHCSFGFHGSDGGGDPVNITAGHCDPAPAAAGTDAAAVVYEWIPDRPYGEPLGRFHRSVFGGSDYAVVAVADAARDRFASNEVRVPGDESLRIDGVATPVVGAPVCKSGATTGFTCGVVREVDVTSRVSDQYRRTPAVELTGLFRTNACALPGDSGGPVLTGTKALGISSNVPSVNLALCPVREPISAGSIDFGPGLIAQPVTAVLAEHPGLTLRTG